jgi:hypothetical protein
MFVPVYLAAFAAIWFYALLPIAGAFIVREQWRQFRTRIAEAARAPELDASVFGSPCLNLGFFRVYGEIDAISGERELWIAGRKAACVVDLRDAWVYVLTGRLGDDTIERLRWKRLPSIGNGARVFVAGEARLRDGRLIIGSGGKDAPLVVLHDGDDDGLVKRAVRSGRHDNEYWNPVTQISIALGVAAMSIIVSTMLPSAVPSLIVALTLSLAFSPILPLLPPGVIGFHLYRTFWKRARYCRSRRDIERLDGDPRGIAASWRLKAYGATAASVAAFAAALAVNLILTTYLLRRFL